MPGEKAVPIKAVSTPPVPSRRASKSPKRRDAAANADKAPNIDLANEDQTAKLSTVLSDPQLLEQRARELFAQADTDRSGALDDAEVLALLRKVSSEHSTTTPALAQTPTPTVTRIPSCAR